ncbi:bifunctional riboflavin kinase/FAD synthetase [Lachnospiraceae bacterium LCP25S3_G4]
MQYIKGLESYKDNHRTAITLGKFDGLHKGHQKLVERVKCYANDNIKSVVFAFDMRIFFREQGLNHKNLMTNLERFLRLENQVDYLVECPFEKGIRNMEAEDFISNVLVKQFHAAYIVVGTDFRFGHKKRGDVHMLAQYARVYGYHLEIIEKELHHGREISSTYIKEEVREGHMERANYLLGYPYYIRGKVVHGRKLGRTLGIPTMNVVPREEKLLPPHGVYATRAFIDGAYYYGLGNVGVKPTITEESIVLLEVYLFDYVGDAYEKRIIVELYQYIRPEKKFNSVEQLKHQIEKDIQYSKEYFGKE